MELSFKKLPFVPVAGQVIYVESAYNEKINKYIKKSYDWLVKEFAENGLSFCYLPLHVKDAIQYLAPNVSVKRQEECASKLPSIAEYAITEKNIEPSLFFAIDLPVTDNLGNYVLQYVEIKPRWYKSMNRTFCDLIKEIKKIEKEQYAHYKKDERIRLAKLASDLQIKKVKNNEDLPYCIVLEIAEHKYNGTYTKSKEEEIRLKIPQIRKEAKENEGKKYSIPIPSPEEFEALKEKYKYSYENTADYHFDDEVKYIIKEIKARIDLLKNKGVNTWILHDLIEDDIKLSRVKITKDHKIFLVDYNNLEVKMTALPKAVFILFLKHPEGLRFKMLSDYYAELKNIYLAMKPDSNYEEHETSIKNITNPFNNSINEKCARIREAFVKVIDENIAKNYFVTGQRGEAKRITLDRGLVIWE